MLRRCRADDFEIVRKGAEDAYSAFPAYQIAITPNQDQYWSLMTFLMARILAPLFIVIVLYIIVFHYRHIRRSINAKSKVTINLLHIGPCIQMLTSPSVRVIDICMIPGGGCTRLADTAVHTALRRRCHGGQSSGDSIADAACAGDQREWRRG